MPNDNKANGWGWIALTAIVCILGVGFLYQREGGRLFTTDNTPAKQVPGSPPAAVGNDPAAKSSPQTGTVNISVKVNFQKFGPWLYVNGAIVKDLSRPEQNNFNNEEVRQTIELKPGKYLIEIGTAGFTAADPNSPQYVEYNGLEPRSVRFPLHFSAFRLTVEPGKTHEAAFEPIPERYIGQVGFVTRNRFNIPPVVDDPNDHKRHIKALREELEAGWKGYQEEIVREALAKIQHVAPTGPTILVPLPEAFRGARELNATQINLIVDWLKDVYCPILCCGGGRTLGPEFKIINDERDRIFKSLKETSPEYVRGCFELMDECDRSRERIDELKAICRKLRQTTK